MLSVLFILGGFIPLIYADFSATMLTVDDGVITGRFSDSVLLSLPPCDQYAGKSVDLEYLNVNTNQTTTLKSIFTVANCSSGINTVGSTAISRNIGYQLKNLSNGTEYRIHYQIGSNKSVPIMATTRSVPDFGNDLSLPARSGAMVVITVILSLAMFFLLICLILSTVMSSA
ncbi:uroplakin-2 [Astyanax mexicanus]|uniref:Uroplakin-2 n=1 Tax=Astyanax mexicanus TaxID=7994 RepID=A0A8B9J921_ASTMX|nr:uroplakin-2 [Astyanax mexicanus]